MYYLHTTVLVPLGIYDKFKERVFCEFMNLLSKASLVTLISIVALHCDLEVLSNLSE